MTALKTLTMYLRAAKPELEAMGEDSEDCANSIAELREKMLALTGVDIMLDDKTFKSTYKTIQDISKVWDRMADVDRAAVTKLIGGKRNANVVQALITNFQDAEDVVATSLNATGSAARENEEVLNSISGKLDLLKGKFQAISESIIGSELVKAGIDIVGWLTNVIGLLGQLPAYIKAPLVALVALTETMSIWKALPGVIKAAFTALAPGSLVATITQPFVLAAVAVAALIGGITALNQAQKKQREEAIESSGKVVKNYSDAQKTYEQNIRSINALKDRYNELSNGVDENGRNLSLTKSQYEEYIGIVRQLVDISPSIVTGYDNEGNALARYKGAIEDAIAAQENLYKSQHEQYLGSGDTIFEAQAAQYEDAKQMMREAGHEFAAAIDQADKENRSGWDRFWSGDRPQKQAIEDALMGIGISKDIAHGWFDRLYSMGGQFATDDDIKALETLYEKRELFFNLINDSGAYGDKINAIKDSVYGLASAYNALSNASSDAVPYLVDFSRTEFQNDVDDWYQNIPVGALDEYEEGLKRVNDEKKSFADNIAAAREYGKSFAEVCQSDVVKGIVQMSRGLDGGKESLEDYNNAVNSLGNEIGGVEYDDIVLSTLKDWLSSLADISSSGTDNIVNIVESLKSASDSVPEAAEQFQKASSILDTAMSEMEESGQISISTFKSIHDAIGDTADISDFVKVENGLLKLNTEAWKEWGNSIANSQLDTLDRQKDSLEEMHEQLNSQAEGMIDIFSGIDDKTINESLVNILSKQYSVGNVDLLNRVRLSGRDMLAAGYEEFEDELDSLVTLYSQTFTAGEEGQDFKFEKDIVIDITPIDAEGNRFSPDDVHNYLEELFGKSGSVEELFENDKAENGGKGLLLHFTPVVDNDWSEAIDASEIWTQALHGISAAYEQSKIGESVSDYLYGMVEEAWQHPELQSEMMSEVYTVLDEVAKELSTRGNDTLSNAMAELDIGSIIDQSKNVDSLTKTYELIQMLEAIINSANAKDDPLNLQSMFEGIDKVKTNASDLVEALSSIQDGELQNMADFAAKHPELMEIPGFMDASTLEEQESVLRDVVSNYQDDITNLIQAKQNELSQEIGLRRMRGESTDDVEAELMNVRKLKELVDLLNGVKVNDPFEALSDSMKKASTYADIIKDAQDGIDFDLIQKMRDTFGEKWKELMTTDSQGQYIGIDLQQMHDLISAELDLDGQNTDLKASFEAMWSAALKGTEVKSEFDQISDAMARAKSSAELMSEYLSGDGMTWDFLEKARSSLGEDFEKYFKKGDNGQYEDFDYELLRINERAKLVQSGVGAAALALWDLQWETIFNGATRASTGLVKLAESLSNVGSAQSLLKSNAEGNLGVIELLDQVASFSDKTKIDMSELILVDEGKLKLNEERVNQYIKDVTDVSHLMSEYGLDEETAIAISVDIQGAQEATDTLDKLGTVISKVSNAKSLLTDIRSGEGDFFNMFQTAMEMAQDSGQSIDDFFNVVGNGVAWNENAVKQYAMTWIDSLAGIDNMSLETVAYMKQLATSQLESTYAAERMNGVLEKSTTILEGAGNANVNTQVTYDQFKALTEISTEYAKALEYNAGIITLNRDKYDEITDSIIRANLAEIEAEKQKILTGQTLGELGHTYQDLKSRIGSLSEAEQNELTGLNAEIMAFEVLANQIRDAASAYADFANAHASTSLTGEKFATAQEAYKVIQDTDYNKDSDRYGRVGLADYQEAVKLLIRPEIDADEANKTLTRYFADAEEGAQNFVDDLYTTGLVDETGQLNQNIGTIAETLGITNEAAESALQNVNTFLDKDSQLKWEPAEVDLSPLEETGDAADAAKESVDGLSDSMGGLSSEGGIDGAASNISDLETRLQNVITAIDGLISDHKIDIDTSAAISKLEELREELQSVFDGVEISSPDVDTSPIQSTISDIISSFKGVINSIKGSSDKSADVKPNVDTGSAEQKLAALQNKIGQVKSAIQSIGGTPVVINTSNAVASVGRLSSSLASVLGRLSSIAARGNISTTITETTIKRTVTENVGSSGASGFGTSAAPGTIGAPGGRTLVGELGREIVVDPTTNTWYTVGDHGAEFVNIPRGALVFNAEQTRQLLSYGRTPDHGEAMLSGNAAANVMGADLVSGKGPRKLTNSKSSGKGKTRKSSSSSKKSGSKNKKSGKKNNKKKSDDGGDDVFDWIEVAIDRVERAISNLSKVASSAFRNLVTRLSATDDEISKVNAEIDIQQRGYERYLAEANKVKLSSDIIERIKNGTIDINQYSDKEKERIERYKEWYDKAMDCSDAIVELNENLSELYKDKFDAVQKDAEDQLSLLEHMTNSFNNGLDMIEERGFMGGQNLYAQMQSVERQNLSVMKKELSDLTNAMSQAVNVGKIQEGSEAWYEMQQEINSVKESIQESEIAILEYANSIREIDWEIFDYIQDKISNINTEAEFFFDLMESSDLYTDNGDFTGTGKVQVGMTALNYDVFMAQADKYAEEVKKLNKELANDPNNTKLIDRRDELLKLQQESIMSAEDEKRAMADLVEEGINIQLNALKELISSYKDSLDNAKSLYDYQNKVRDQAQQVASLQKQIAAYQGDTSEENRARLQKLTVDLSDAMEDLEQTQYDRYISDQKKLLDDLYDEYEEVLNSRIDDVDALMNDMIVYANENALVIEDTIREESDMVGYTLSGTMEDIWTQQNDVLARYGDAFLSNAASIITAVNSIQTQVNSIVTAASQIAQQVVSSTTASTAASAPAASSGGGSVPASSPSAPAASAPAAAATGGAVQVKNGVQAYVYSSGPKKGNKMAIIHAGEKYQYLGEQKASNGELYYQIQYGKKTGWFNAKYGKKLGFSQGGFIADMQKMAMKNGDDIVTFNTLKRGEAVLTPEQAQQFKLFTQRLPQLQGMIDTSGKLISLGAINATNGTSSANIDYGGFNLTFQIDHVQDYNDFVRQLRDDKTFEKMLKSIVLDPLTGGTSLVKKKYYK